MNNSQDMSLTEIFNIYTNNSIDDSSRLFRISANLLWDRTQQIADKIDPIYSDEMICTLMRRLFNRRLKPFEPISTPKAYINTALRNIRKDIWRREHRRSGSFDGNGNFNYFQSLDFVGSEDTRSLHEKIGDDSFAPDQENEQDNTKLYDQIRQNLFENEIHQVPLKTRKGKETFLREALRFIPFSKGDYKLKDQTHYKRFDRQRQKMLQHLFARVEGCSESSFDSIQKIINEHQINEQRIRLIETANKDPLLNPEIVSREIDLQVALRALEYEIEECFEETVHNLDQIINHSRLRELVCHCQYQIFRTEMFRTKRNQGEISSIYFENV